MPGGNYKRGRVSSPKSLGRFNPKATKKSGNTHKAAATKHMIRKASPR